MRRADIHTYIGKIEEDDEHHGLLPVANGKPPVDPWSHGDYIILASKKPLKVDSN